MIMAAAKAVAGPCAVFWVVPLSGGLLVLATFGVGRALGSPGAGLLAAVFVLASPVVLFMLMSPMTDIPVAAAWAAAIWLLIGGTPDSARRRAILRATGAGLAAAIAILIRPNLVGGVLALGLWFPLRMMRDGPRARRRHAVDAAFFGAAVAIGVVVVALVNQRLYGSPTTSGYGAASRLFDLANVWPNVKTYFGWFRESQTLAPLLGLIVLFVPQAAWPGLRDRAALVVIAAFVVVATGSYLMYGVYDAWWYLRFLLPVWPFVMLGFAATVLGAARRSRVLSIAMAVVVVWIVARDVVFAREHDAFRLWMQERRYATVGRLVRAATEPGSVIFSIQHSGSLRLYAGRMTLRFDSLEDDWLDRAIAWLSSHGIASYLLVEEWETPRFKGKFRNQDAVSRVDAPPLLEYTGPAIVRLYDLRASRDSMAPVTRIKEEWQGPKCQAMAPAPQALERE